VNTRTSHHEIISINSKIYARARGIEVYMRAHVSPFNQLPGLPGDKIPETTETEQREEESSIVRYTRRAFENTQLRSRADYNYAPERPQDCVRCRQPGAVKVSKVALARGFSRNVNRRNPPSLFSHHAFSLSLSLSLSSPLPPPALLPSPPVSAEGNAAGGAPLPLIC